MTRDELNQYYIKQALKVSEKSDCIRRQVGCVAVNKDTKQMILSGYNHSINGPNYCNKNSCYRTKNNIKSGELLDHCLALHAEQDLICNSNIVHLNLSKCDIYITHHPCVTCLKLLIACNVKRIYYLRDYPVNDVMKEILNNNSIKIIKVNLTQ